MHDISHGKLWATSVLDCKILTEYNLIMDVKVYQKEEVLQPSGSSYVYKPDVIDFIPVITTDESGREVITNLEILTETDTPHDLLQQECALSTIWQKGLDPLDLDSGISWSESLLGEVSVIQLMDELQSAVEAITTSVVVLFDILTDSKGIPYLTYTLQEVA